MSKLSFRARALDASKPMPVYKAEEIPDLPDFAAINRAVPQMPTGMEKEEESEHHLQRALSAQQVYGTAESLVIPIPDIGIYNDEYQSTYQGDFKVPKQYIHVQAFGMDQEIPDYDMDSEDEGWLNKQTKKMEVTAQQFEEMMDRLEKGSGQQVVTLQEAKLLLKEDDDLIIAVYDYWLNKKLRAQQSVLQNSLIPTVKTEKRDGSTTNNPYVAFRRRTEKMQTRKNRKNDEVSYEKMLKLRRDLNRTVTLFEMIKRREKTKKELLQLTIEIVEKRYDVEDYNGEMLAKAEAVKHTRPTYYPLTQYNVNREWGGRSQEETGFVRKKREYKKRKHKQSQQQVTQPSVQLPQYHEVDVLHTDPYSSEDEPLSPMMSSSDHEDENDPDGAYAFRRKANCSYQAPILDGLGNWPWCSQEDGGFGDKKYRYSLASLRTPHRCVGFARRRIGRGGRIIIDRAFSEWNDDLWDLDIASSQVIDGPKGELLSYIKENKWSHYRPRTPTEDQQPPTKSLSSTPVPLEFNIESFQSHQEQLLQMQRLQQEQLLKQEALDLDSSINLEHSFASQPTSRFTLDSATAKFAASAVRDVQPCAEEFLKTENGATSAMNPPTTNAVPNGPVSDSKTIGLSTSPAATVLQLNFPINSTLKKESKTSVESPLTITAPSSESVTIDPVGIPATVAVTPEELNVITVDTTKTNDTSINISNENHEEKSSLQVKVDNQVYMEVT